MLQKLWEEVLLNQGRFCGHNQQASNTKGACSSQKHIMNDRDQTCARQICLREEFELYMIITPYL